MELLCKNYFYYDQLKTVLHMRFLQFFKEDPNGTKLQNTAENQYLNFEIYWDTAIRLKPDLR